MLIIEAKFITKSIKIKRSVYNQLKQVKTIFKTLFNLRRIKVKISMNYYNRKT